MSREQEKQGAGSAEQGAIDGFDRQFVAILAVCLGQPVVVCDRGGIVARGVLDFSEGRFGIVGANVQFRAAVGSVTIEPDLVTIHLGPIA